MVNMLALTVQQPWASLIVLGHKTLDSRGFNTFYRGPLAIHSSNSRGGLEWSEKCPPLLAFLGQHGLKLSDLPLGAVLGECQLVDVTKSEIKPVLAAHCWFINPKARYTFHLASAVAYQDPIKTKGFLRLWPWERPLT